MIITNFKDGNMLGDLSFRPFEEHGIEEESRLVLYNNVEGDFSHLLEIEPFEKAKIDLNTLESHFDYKFKYQLKKNGKWTDHIKYKYLKPEQETDKGIKYLFYPDPTSQHLIIVFQAINKNPGYNYIRTLKDIKASKLFIKDDYGEDELTRSSYYLGKNRTNNIEEPVHELILRAKRTLNIDSKNIICAGSSKGGFAALFFGYKYGFGNIVAGGPQVLLGNYLGKGKLEGSSSILPPILKYLAGEVSQESIEWANGLMETAVRSLPDHDPKTYIHVGRGEPHYEEHVLPFIKMAEAKKNLEVDLGEYNTHSELSVHYPEYLKKAVGKLIK
ncbi:hypothetical protein [Pseudalkalibacillus caeni]|uniref:Two component regulator three Y domain-containing protein n=1 Tax=Exobacillus caeni TaxID=2574798 RepID=A0A5R9FGL9_9BACL|nr:hypothetical protein [Pseudalkalibacillus caeni]TLS38685.1 hypothetical protein FCL54_04060 [Pseudalkalibacillus caeni]